MDGKFAKTTAPNATGQNRHTRLAQTEDYYLNNRTKVPLLSNIHRCVWSFAGSHNSTTAYLDKDRPIASDQPKFLQAFSSQSLIRAAVYNWSKDQCLTLSAQLQLGVRYFDFRVAVFENEFRFLHGLYCQDVPSALLEIIEFLAANRKEIVLMDFNHFYNFSAENHLHLLALLHDLLGDKLCPSTTTIAHVTLAKLWEANRQALVFYQIQDPTHKQQVALPDVVWTAAAIRSPWPKTDNAAAMVNAVERFLNGRSLSTPNFHVCQAIVTLDSREILKQPTGTFEQLHARKATACIAQWLADNGATLRNKINVLLADFVEEADFCKTVIALNDVALTE